MENKSSLIGLSFFFAKSMDIFLTNYAINNGFQEFNPLASALWGLGLYKNLLIAFIVGFLFLYAYEFLKDKVSRRSIEYIVFSQFGIVLWGVGQLILK